MRKVTTIGLVLCPLAIAFLAITGIRQQNANWDARVAERRFEVGDRVARVVDGLEGMVIGFGAQRGHFRVRFSGHLAEAYMHEFELVEAKP